MCQKKPGLRCSKHANRANKRAASQVQKLYKKKNKSFEDIHAIECAKKYHDYNNDLYFASPHIFNMLNKKSPRYKDAEYFNNVFSKVLKNMKDIDNATNLKVGNFVRLSKNKIKKTKDTKNMVVYKNKTIYKIWNIKNPYIITTINNEGNIVNVETIRPEKNAYGFEKQKQPDSRWIIWYTYKNS
jgi:CRISPR/Cas system CSM-associated protein Csm2 small subunit